MMQQLLAGYLLNAAWQVPVVAAIALIVARFAGLSPRARNALWIAFLGVAAVLPALALAALLPHATPSVARVAASAMLDAQAVAPTVVPVHAAPAAQPEISLAPWSVWTMTALFGLVALGLVARLAAAAAAARRLVAGSTPVVLPAAITQAVEKLARSHGRAAPPVRRSAGVFSPAVVGAFRPVILIPEDMAAEGEDLRAALLHETAHVLRHDYAINLVCELVTLPVCWHPAIFGIKAGVRSTRELACDAMAASAMASPKTYARCLVSLAQTLGAASSNKDGAPASTALAVGLFGRSDLEDRLMQLMKPADAEAPVLRAARLCGLAAVGAGLLGSAALLHVTPVFAQAAQPQATAPAPTPSAKSPAAVAEAQSRTDAGAPVRKHHWSQMIASRKGLIISDDGVIIEKGGSGYRHSFTASDGKPMTVINDDPNEPTAEQQRAWETTARDAEAKAEAAEKLVNSPEFKARIAKAEAAGKAAEAMVNSPEFKARIASAEAAGKAAQAMVSSPEFKARIASAEAAAKAAQAMVNSPEFKARIASAEAAGKAAAAMVNSPEFKARMARVQADVERMHDLDVRVIEDHEAPRTAP